MVHHCRDECGNVRVEANAGHIEKQMAAEFSGVNGPCLCPHTVLDGLSRVEWDSKLSGKAVTRSAGNDAESRERLVRRRFIRPLHERASDLIDRAISSPCNHNLGTRRGRFQRELVRVSSALGQLNRSLNAKPLDRSGREPDPLAGVPSACRPRHWVDDDNDAVHKRFKV
jgi:hypothetical protein